MNNFKVYKHTFPNNKVYIGITKRKPETRWRNGEGYTGQCVYSAILKYGWSNIQHEILFENLTYEEACEKEILLIALYKSNQREFGYNIDKGGHSQLGLSEETKRKIGEKAKISNQKRSSEFYKAIGKKNKGKKHSLETKQKIHKSCVEATKHISKPVVMIDPETKEIIAVFSSAYEAVRLLRLSKNVASRIWECCNKKCNRKTVHGYIWKYVINQ